MVGCRGWAGVPPERLSAWGKGEERVEGVTRASSASFASRGAGGCGGPPASSPASLPSSLATREIRVLFPARARSTKASNVGPRARPSGARGPGLPFACHFVGSRTPSRFARAAFSDAVESTSRLVARRAGAVGARAAPRRDVAHTGAVFERLQLREYAFGTRDRCGSLGRSPKFVDGSSLLTSAADDEARLDGPGLEDARSDDRHRRRGRRADADERPRRP